MRYEVGDKVYVKPEVIKPANQRMIELYGGKICTIGLVANAGAGFKAYKLLEDPLGLIWWSDNFEPAEHVEDSRFDDIDILLNWR